MKRSSLANSVLATMLAACALAASSFVVAEKVVIEDTVIRGNEELPKVLYVLPWKNVPERIPEQHFRNEPTVLSLSELDPVQHSRELAWRGFSDSSTATSDTTDATESGRTKKRFLPFNLNPFRKTAPSSISIDGPADVTATGE